MYNNLKHPFPVFSPVDILILGPCQNFEKEIHAVPLLVTSTINIVSLFISDLTTE